MSEDRYEEAQLRLVQITNTAVLLRNEADGGEEWIPKSLMSARGLAVVGSSRPGDEIYIEIKTWKLREVGW